MKHTLTKTLACAAALGLAACGAPDDEGMEVPEVEETAPPPPVPVTPPDTMMADTMMMDSMADTMTAGTGM